MPHPQEPRDRGQALPSHCITMKRKRLHPHIEDPVIAAKRRLLREGNREYTSTLVQVPPDKWPAEYQSKKGVTHLEVWRSNQFLVQVVQEDRDAVGIRLSVNRTALNDEGNTWADGITWDELMEIKRQCGYANTWAIEIFPPDHYIVNVAAIRHLWLLNTAPPQAWTQKAP